MLLSYSIVLGRHAVCHVRQKVPLHVHESVSAAQQWQITKKKTGPKPDIGLFPFVPSGTLGTKKLKVLNVSYGYAPNIGELGKPAHPFESKKILIK